MYINHIPENRALWDYVEKCGRARRASDENRIGRMRIAWWITKATDTHSECVSVVAQTRLNVNVYTYITCLLRIFLILHLYVVRLSFFFCPAFICVV